MFAIVAALLLHIATTAQAPESNASDATKVKTAPNAAVLYRQALKELLKALPVAEYSDMVDMPEDLYDAQPDYTGKVWREAVRKSAVAISLFNQATQIDSCAFDADSKEITTEFMTYAVQLHAIRMLVAARAWQQQENDPLATGVTAMQLLRHANHCSTDQTLMGPATGFAVEELAVVLLQASTKQLATQEHTNADAKRFLKQLTQHIATRPTRASLAHTAVQELTFILDHGLVEAAKNPALKAATKRAHEIHGEMVAPLLQSPPVSVKALAAHYKGHIDRLRKLTKAKKLSTVLENGTGETLAAVLVVLCAQDGSRILEPCLQALEKLEACRIELVKLADK